MFPELWWNQRHELNAQYLKSFEIKSEEEIAKDRLEKEKKKLKKKTKKTLCALVKQENEHNEENNDDDSDTDDGSSEDSLDEEVVQVPTNKSDEDYAKITDASKGINPPWRITGSIQTFVQLCISCIVYPIGYSEYNMGSTKLFSQMGHVKGVTMIDITKCLMDLILFAILIKNENYPRGYITYFSLLSSIYSKLLAPIVHHDDVDSLYMKTVEFVTIQNGCFPPSESYFTYHQLVDLPHYIKHLGPLRNWWTLPGERALKTVKSYITDGGINYYKGVFRKCTSGIIPALTKTYSDETFYFDNKRKFLAAIKKDNKNVDSSNQIEYDLFFTDFKSKLYDSYKKEIIISFNIYEISRLLIFMVQEIMRFCKNDINEALKQSTVYRLYYSSQLSGYLHRYEKLNINYPTTTIMRRYSFFYFLRDVGLFKGDLISLSQVYNVREYLNKGNIISEDYDNAKILWKLIVQNELIQTVYKKATIWGMDFTSRGMECRENEELNGHKRNKKYGAQSEQIHPVNPINEEMYKYIHDKKHYSSWCKFHLNKYNISDKYFEEMLNNKDTGRPSVGFSQINFFFRLSGLSFDALLNNMPIASITTRKPSNNDDRIASIKNCNKECNIYEMLLSKENYDDNFIFVSIYNIYSLPILSIPFIKYQYPHSTNRGEMIKKTIPIMKLDRKCTNYESMIEKLIEVEICNDKDKRLNNYGFLTLMVYARERECIHENTLVYKSIHPYYNKSHHFYETILDE
jgi:hypothetical protein